MRVAEFSGILIEHILIEHILIEHTLNLAIALNCDSPVEMQTQEEIRKRFCHVARTDSALNYRNDDIETMTVEKMKLELLPVQDPTTFYLTALRLNGRSETPDFYTFLLETNGEMSPLIADGQVILFTHIDLAERALGIAGISAEFKTLSLKNAYLIDVAAALHLLDSENADSSKTIANMLDLFARILTTIGIGVPAVFADTLIELGNYVDTHEFYGDFIEREQMTRARAVDAVRWCLGTIFSVVKLVTRPE